jgi:3-hydroxypropanoate dehydrogenase
MSHIEIDQAARELLYLDAHTPKTFGTAPVSDDQIREIWELMKFAPTASNTNPLRIVVLKSAEARARLVPLMAPGNDEKTRTAPATLILAADTRFHEHLPALTPHVPDAFERFDAWSPEDRHDAARFSALLQAGYLILAVRAAGLNAGPMLGFDRPGVDAEFFPDGRLSTLLVMNIGEYGPEPHRPRAPRLAFDEVVTFM